MAVVGHDLRTPLSAVRMGAALLARNSNLNPKEREHVFRIATSGARMARMISDLIDFGRLRRGEALSVEMNWVDLEEVCRHAIAEIQPNEIGRHICLSSIVEASIRCDRGRLHQAVSNLVGNAVQHGAAGAPITVAIVRRDGELVVEVHNEGAPIPPDLLPDLFEPFKRGEGDERGARAGSVGLGLFIVREIARLHGGTVDVDSGEGRGTTFRIRLPETHPDAKHAPVSGATGGDQRQQSA